MKNIFGIAFAMVLVVVGIIYLRESGSMQTAQATTYQNVSYNYSLSLPAGLDVKEYTPEIVTFGHIDGEMVDGIAEARIMTIEGQADMPFMALVVRDLSNLCAADGPTASFSCDGIERSAQFTSAGGVSGTEIYLKGALKELQTGTSTPVEMGPYFVFLRQSGATASSILVIHAPLNQNAAEADTATIRAIAESLSF